MVIIIKVIAHTHNLGYLYPIETKYRCGRQELLAAPVRTTGCSLTKRGTKAEMLINPRDGFLPDSLGDQREVGFGMWWRCPQARCNASSVIRPDKPAGQIVFLPIQKQGAQEVSEGSASVPVTTSPKPITGGNHGSYHNQTS